MVNNEIKKLRKEMGKTQLELAQVIGLKTASAYSKKENGKVPFSIEEMKVLALYFNVALETICS